MSIADKARMAVLRAISRGELARPSKCEGCGRIGYVVAHHHKGYQPENALDVEWLCESCHIRIHSRHPKSPDGIVRMLCVVSEDFHHRVKLEAVRRKKTISEFCEGAIRKEMRAAGDVK